MKRTLLIVAVAIVVAAAVAPAVSASAPGGAGLLIGWIDTASTVAYVNGQIVGLRGGWFAVCLPAGPQAAHIIVPHEGSRVLSVDVPSGSWVAVLVGRL